MEQVQQPIKRFIRKYYEDKQLYLKPNTKFLLEEIRKDSSLSGLTTRDIMILRNTLYEMSRIRHYRHNKKKQEFRSYITFSPGNTALRNFTIPMPCSNAPARPMFMSNAPTRLINHVSGLVFQKDLNYLSIFRTLRTLSIKNEHLLPLEPNTRLF